MNNSFASLAVVLITVLSHSSTLNTSSYSILNPLNIELSGVVDVSRIVSLLILVWLTEPKLEKRRVFTSFPTCKVNGLSSDDVIYDINFFVSNEIPFAFALNDKYILMNLCIVRYFLFSPTISLNTLNKST